MIELLVRKEKLKSGSTAFVLEPSTFSIGALGANIVDEIHLVVPDEWIESKIAITFSPKENKKVFIPVNKEMIAKVTADISTVDGLGTIVVTAEKENGYVAFSTGARYTAYFHPDAIVNNPDSNPTKELCRNELAESLETATGESQDGKTWDELNETVSTLPVISEEQTQALGDWDLVKSYYANIVSDYVRIFRLAPKDETGADMDYRLPYIYTPRINWSSAGVISKNLLEFGVDVSSTNSIGNNEGTRVFSPLPKLQRLVVTGNENSQSLQRFMYQNTSLQYVKMDTPSEKVLKVAPSYYVFAFHSCSSLQTIDCELDFTGQTSTVGMFNGCNNLKNLRIKPFTLSCSLNVSACKYFTHPTIRDNSLLAILNALSNDKEKNKDITITYSNEAWSFETSGVVPGVGIPIPMEFISNTVYFTSNVNPETGEELGLYTWDRQSEASVETTLYNAFINDKGVTLAQ